MFTFRYRIVLLRINNDDESNFHYEPKHFPFILKTLYWIEKFYLNAVNKFDLIYSYQVEL